MMLLSRKTDIQKNTSNDETPEIVLTFGYGLLYEDPVDILYSI